MPERLPPHDIAAEEAVIGSLLIDGDAIHKIATTVQPSDFYSERGLLIYSACDSLYRRSAAINQITVAQELARQGRLETCGGAAYLSHLISICPTSLDIEHYAQIVYRLSMMRQLVNASDKIAAIGYDAAPDVEDSLGKAEDLLFKLRRAEGKRDFVHLRQILDQYFEATAAATEAENKSLLSIPSGFTALDEFLGGLQRSDLVIVAGRPSMGKTSLALNIARNAAVDYGATVAMFSLEMSREPLVLRLLSGESEIDVRRIRFGQHSEQEEARIMKAMGVLSEAPMYIDDTPLSRIVEMRSKARRLQYEHGVDMIIIDHLGLIQTEGRNENRAQEISYITRSLKAMAREFNVPLIAVSQLSRASEGRISHRPQLSDLRDSGSIEQDADVVMFVYRDEYYYKTQEDWDRENPDSEFSYPPPAEIIIAKHRNGPTGTINLKFEPALATFKNASTQTSIQEQSLL